VSDAVRRLAPKRVIRGLTAATAALGVAGGACALALPGSVTSGAVAHRSPVVAAAPAGVRSGGGGNDYFACATVFDYGVCIGPPVTF
jgi:hypothetical protein